MDLTERKLKILQAIIDSYIKTAEPVGSRTLARQFDNIVSPATIRNEMSDLEEMGYLTHPHTSAGRVPSDKAYRLYVDDLMQKVELSEEEQLSIRSKLLEDVSELDKTIRRATELLSEITNLAAFAITPTQAQDKLNFVNFIPIDERSVILMIVADSGKSQNTLLHLEEPCTPETLRLLSKTITRDFRGMALSDVLTESIIDEFKTDVSAMGRLAHDIRPSFLRTLEELLNVDLYMDGLSNIFDIPEFSDHARAKSFISMFDRRDELRKTLMDRGEGVVVTIGSENTPEEMRDCSLITATYHVNGRYVGKIGVIGPTRMRYGEITSLVQYMTDNLNDAFSLQDADREDDDE